MFLRLSKRLSFKSSPVKRKMSANNYSKASELLNPKKTNAKITSITPLNNDQSRFIKLKKIDYITPLGDKAVWEMATRSTRPIDSKVDAVIIIPVLKDSEGNKQLLFVRQFRPPIGGICVEFPAGLIDPNDSIESCALRELKEETGYIGKICRKSNILWSDPGLADANCIIVWVDVDLTIDENINPKPHWMDHEVIEVVKVNFKDVAKTIDDWSNQGYLIDSKVQSFIFGMSLND